MNKGLYILLSVCMMQALHSKAQRCDTQVDLNWLKANAPDRYQRFVDLENLTQAYINNNSLHSPPGVITIPVVVHVLHNGEPVGTGLNISDGQIQSQINVLNEDFRRLNADRVNTPSDFASRAADMQFQFQLACFDPNGNPTNGIVRKSTTKKLFVRQMRPTDQTYDDVAIGVKYEPTGSNAWPTDKYLNIWVCNLYNLWGYANWPADYSKYPQEDGVVINTYAFGRIGNLSPDVNLGRTTTHEIGHWLNLKHIWGETYCGDDLVDDTPTETGPHSKCPSYPDLAGRCNSSDPSTMYMNYMEWTPDRCLNMFTNGQKNRADALFAYVLNLQAPRINLLQNFFTLKGQPTTFNCNGTYTVSPVCLPVTWSVSGAAVIISGQGTSQVAIRATANGPVRLTANWNNASVYLDLTATGAVAPGMPDVAAVDWNNDCTVSMRATVAGADCYNWSVSGDLRINGQSTYLSCAPSIITLSGNGQGGYVTVNGSIHGCPTSSSSIYYNVCQPWPSPNFTWVYQAPATNEPLEARTDDFPGGALQYRWYVGSQLIQITNTPFLDS